MSSPFTLTIDWLAFTLPSGSVQDTMQMLGGDWTKSDTGFRGYPTSWITTGRPWSRQTRNQGLACAPRSACGSVRRYCRPLADREGPDGAPMDSDARGSPHAPRLCLRRSK